MSNDQHIIPIQNDEFTKLSAILLDDEYFNLIKDGVKKSTEGFSIINEKIVMCLKARAFRDLRERKVAGDKHIDSKDIQKHLKDIFRLVPSLNDGSSISLKGRPQKDMQLAVDELNKLDARTVKQFMSGNPIVNKNELLEFVRKAFF